MLDDRRLFLLGESRIDLRGSAGEIETPHARMEFEDEARPVFNADVS
jgi:hypothetical protein